MMEAFATAAILTGLVVLGMIAKDIVRFLVEN